MQRYFTAHGTAALAQSWLIHGLAGLALAVVTLALAHRLIGTPRLVAAGAGLAASAVSLSQVAFMQALHAHVVGGGTASGTARWFDAINTADSVKLALLGVLVATVTLSAWTAGWLPRWLCWLGAVLGPLLPLSGAAFPLRSSALYAALYLSLPLLLVWIAGAAVSGTRAVRESAPAAG